MAETIRCTHCKQDKPVDEFHRDLNSARGYNYYCKPCAAQLRKVLERARAMAETERTKGHFGGEIRGTKSRRTKKKQRVISPDTIWCVNVRSVKGSLSEELCHGSYEDCLRRLNEAPLPAMGLLLQLEPRDA